MSDYFDPHGPPPIFSPGAGKQPTLSGGFYQYQGSPTSGTRAHANVAIMQCARFAVLVVVTAFFSACSRNDPGPTPTPPAINNPDFGVITTGAWYLVGNALTPSQNEYRINVKAPEGVSEVHLWLGEQRGIRLSELDDIFTATLDLTGLAPGEYSVLLAADGSEQAFHHTTLHRSHPLYVFVTTDWDNADNTQEALDLQQDLHNEHPALKLTHFVGPYTFTDPELTNERRRFLADWVIAMRNQYDDEIGLHIHPYCNFVESAGLPCKTQPSTVFAEGDDTGYTVMCTGYTEQEFASLLDHADELFREWGLNKSTSFRAGGWTADLSTLRALASRGYVADTSANNWRRMEEWKDQRNGVLYRWNSENWSTIHDTSQAYYPSVSNILESGGTNSLDILEVPDNGILVDYVSTEEMIDIFHANWPGEALSQPVQYSIGYHPSNFNAVLKRTITDAMSHLDQHLAADHNGPVVYETLSNATVVWPKNH